jgi:hypothetical protein
VTTFSERVAAIRFVQDHPGRYVVKFNEAYETFVGQLDDGRDVLAFLVGLPSQGSNESFILMQHVEGVEMGVGAYFRRREIPQAVVPRLGAQAVLPRRSRRADRRNGNDRHISAHRTLP